MAVSINWGSFSRGVLMIRAVVFWSPYLGPLIFGNSHMSYGVHLDLASAIVSSWGE